MSIVVGYVPTPEGNATLDYAIWKHTATANCSS